MMTSRRPMTRSFSGNGRTSSFSEDEGSSSNGRSESRNSYLSNVRPENSYSRYSHYRPMRSTLCSVMAQLTEETQPSFETTLKSKAVSENCNVKFTCVVSGYPAPELKWYKDDMEMDRYCGLPKYEIHRNGKMHTLHIYNCTLDDAAIYQVSASNSKGIVSCSGVLEVGVMNEFKIHQQFFDKLKKKAEKKKKELEEQTKKEDKENIQIEKPQTTPERPPRKRPVPPPQERPAVKDPETVEQLGAAAEPSGVSAKIKKTPSVTSIDSGLEKEIAPSEETLSKKKIKITNGVDDGINGSSGNQSHMMGNGGDNCYDGGISLAQFLAETLQSQASEEMQSSSQVEKPKEMDIPVLNASMEKEREQEKIQKDREEEEKALEEECERKKRSNAAFDVERKKETPFEMLHTTGHSKHGSEVKHHSKTHNDHDHHIIQASISSMLHTVKDFFFGKSKKDSRDHIDNKGREVDLVTEWRPQPETPPSFRLQPKNNPDVYKPFTEDVVPMETDKLKECSERMAIDQHSVSLVIHDHKYEDSDLPSVETPSHKLAPESIQVSTEQSVKQADDAVEAMEVSVGTGSSSLGEEVSLSGLQCLTKMEEKGSRIVTAIKEVPVNQPEPHGLVVFSQTNHQAARDESSPKEDISVLPQTKAPNEEEYTPSLTLTSSKDSWSPTQKVISVSDSDSLAEAPTETLQEEEMSVNKMSKEFKPDTEDSRSSNKLWEEEKAEVKLGEQCSDLNRSEITELTSSLEEKLEPCESQTPDQVSSRLSAVMVVRDNIKEEAECTLLIQEMNVGFPPITTHERLEMGDLKTQHDGTHVVAESTEVHNLSAIQSSESDFSKERSELKEVLNSALKKDLEVTLSNSQETEENAILGNKNTGERNVSLQSEIKTEKKVEKLDELEIRLVTQNEESLEELSKVVCQDGNERQLGWPLGNIPQIQISTTEDTLDITQAVPDVNQNEHFIIPKIEIMEPEFKECHLPLTILALNKPESDAGILQEHDAIHVSEVIIQAESKENSPGSLPTQNNCKLSPTQKVKEVAQLDDKPEIFEREQSHVKNSEQLSQMEYALIPVKNVSFTNDKKDDASADAQASHTLQLCHQFDVSIVPVNCHENDPRLTLPAPSVCTETETSDFTQRGTKYNVDNNRTTKPEKSQSLKQNLEVVAENSIKDSTSLPYEALISKIGHNVPSVSKTEDNALEILKIKPLKEITIVNFVSVVDQPRNTASVERLSSKPPIQPPLSPASARKFMSRTVADSDNEAVKAVPIITVSDPQTDKADKDLSGGSTPTSSLSRESSPRLKRRDSLSLIRSATPEELASGARRKIFIPKAKEDGDGVVVGAVDTQGKKETPYMSPSQAPRAALLQTPTGQNTPPLERRSPLLGRRKATLEVPKVVEETPKEEPISTKKEEKPAEKKRDPLKAPQVIRKIRGEPFPDASGHLKLWCQFFNVLSDSTIKWYKDEEEILEMKRSGGDESQVALAIVLASSQDCGVYGCTINNEYGTDTTDFLLSTDIMSEILLRDYLEVGEEIEMTPLLFAKGLADSGNWGDKYFGRIMTKTVYIGEGYAHKASRVKAIYGLDPVFESGSTCIIKIKNPIPYGTKQESNLAEMNLAITKHECKVQNLIREYCKIFAAEARANENFGDTLELIPRYLMYRPANSVPYATVEADLKGVFNKYCTMDAKGKLITQTVHDVEQKCSTFQHWIHQWTHGNLLVTRLEGVETKLTNVGVVTKSKGYQGLTQHGSPEIFEQFMTHHQCNYYCGLLGLHPLKPMESQQPKTKGSKSPLLNRKLGSSPQMSRKASPKVTRKVQETEDNKSDVTSKPAEIGDALEMR